MKNFRTYDLAKDFYRTIETLSVPRHLRDQLLRASSSIALNLAEGAGRDSKPDQRRFFSIAMGSFRESKAILELLSITETEILELADKLGAHLFRLVQNTR